MEVPKSNPGPGGYGVVLLSGEHRKGIVTKDFALYEQPDGLIV